MKLKSGTPVITLVTQCDTWILQCIVALATYEKALGDHPIWK